VTHLVRLVDELLDVSRISQGRISLKKEQVELAKVIAHGAETVRPVVEARRQTLAISLPAAPVWVSGDFVRLAQVVGNLLNNAAKYTQDGGRIEISAAASEGTATVIVRDNGAGIEPQLLPQVFDLFVQGNRTLDRREGGLGIGLTLVRYLVELHQGRVEASSGGPGQGAKFEVWLPCISSVNAEAVPAAGTAPPLRVQGRRVLVVDDNVDAAESIAMSLRFEGHEVKVVADPWQAIASAEVFAPQAVVLDIGLPGMNGYEVARKLRQQAGSEDMTLIALTGYGQKDDRKRALDAGFDYHFVKPASTRDIQVAIGVGRATGHGKPAEVAGQLR